MIKLIQKLTCLLLGLSIHIFCITSFAQNNSYSTTALNRFENSNVFKLCPFSQGPTQETSIGGLKLSYYWTCSESSMMVIPSWSLYIKHFLAGKVYKVRYRKTLFDNKYSDSNREYNHYIADNYKMIIGGDLSSRQPQVTFTNLEFSHNGN